MKTPTSSKRAPASTTPPKALPLGPTGRKLIVVRKRRDSPAPQS